MVLNVGRPPLFIEVGMLENKLNKIEYKLERILISKNSKKIGFILIRRFPSWAEHLGHKPSWVTSPIFNFGSIWTPFLRIF